MNLMIYANGPMLSRFQALSAPGHNLFSFRFDLFTCSRRRRRPS
jgi:hypothetical protein